MSESTWVNWPAAEIVPEWAMSDPLDIPLFLRVTSAMAAKRKTAWAATPPPAYLPCPQGEPRKATLTEADQAAIEAIERRIEAEKVRTEQERRPAKEAFFAAKKAERLERDRLRHEAEAAAREYRKSLRKERRLRSMADRGSNRVED